MTPRPVHWHEGMFLRPHHFQAADRHAARVLDQNVRMNCWYSWGFRRCEIDLEALAGLRLVVRALEARFRDGTTVSLPDDAPAADVDLKAAFAAQSELDIFLALPKWRSGQPNLLTPSSTAPARYRESHLPVDDENTGVNPQRVPFRTPAIRILLGDEDRSGYEVLHLCRLEKSEGAQATPKLATGFIPPVLACDAWPALWGDVLQQVYYRLHKKIEVLASQVTTRGISFDGHSPGDARRMHQLSRMNEGHAVLEHVAFTPGVHPEAAYLELRRLVGQLAVFGPGGRAPALPRYDHDDLGGCFWKLKTELDALLGAVEEPAYQERPFVGAGRAMRVALEPDWLESGWQMFLGVRASVTTDECVKVLNQPERLAMKIGSSDRVDTIFTNGETGMRFTPAPRPPRELPPPAAGPPSMTYFEVSRESATNEWAHVVRAKTLAIRVREREVVGSIDGQRVLNIRTDGQTNTYTFTLYLVPAVK